MLQDSFAGGCCGGFAGGGPFARNEPMLRSAVAFPRCRIMSARRRRNQIFPERAVGIITSASNERTREDHDEEPGGPFMHGSFPLERQLLSWARSSSMPV